MRFIFNTEATQTLSPPIANPPLDASGQSCIAFETQAGDRQVTRIPRVPPTVPGVNGLQSRTFGGVPESMTGLAIRTVGTVNVTASRSPHVKPSSRAGRAGMRGRMAGSRLSHDQYDRI